MKAKHFLLFIATCVALYLSDIFAGSLIAVALLFQFNLLYAQIPLSKKSQLAALKMFFVTIPLFFFLGGIHSFVFVYANDGQWFGLLAATFISYFLFFLVDFFSLFSFRYLEMNHFNLTATYQAAFNDIKNKKKSLFQQTLLLLIFSFVPYLATEWKIVFAITATQALLHHSPLKRAFGYLA